MILALAVPLAFMAADSASTTAPPGNAFVLTGGMVLTAPPQMGVMPLPLLSAQLAHGLSERLDLRVHYDSVVPCVHRVGVELRARLWGDHAWALAIGVEPSAEIIAVPYRGLYSGGDVSTSATALLTRSWSSASLTIEAGTTVQWMVFDGGNGRFLTDTRPHLTWFDFGARVEWAHGAGRTFLLGLDVSVLLDRDDPLALLGMFPRVVFGGSWSR